VPTVEAAIGSVDNGGRAVARATAKPEGNGVDPMASLPIDDQDAAVYSVGQVAGMLQVTQAFLRRLDELAVVCPARSAGGQRRYPRRQIATVARVRELAGEGLTLSAARRVLAGRADQQAAAARPTLARRRRSRRFSHHIPAAATATSAAFAVAERRASHPMLPPAIFAPAQFRAAKCRLPGADQGPGVRSCCSSTRVTTVRSCSPSSESATRCHSSARHSSTVSLPSPAACRARRTSLSASDKAN
jgi:MerR family transcriptional regulator, heat shock protein HspR